MNIADNAFETHDALMITDADSNIIRINKAFETITGYAEEDVLGKNTRIFKSGRHGKSFYMALWQGLLRNGFWSGEVWDRHKNGNTYPKHLTITAIKNSEGVTTEYVASFLDITDQKKDEIELLRFRSIIDSSDDAIISKTLGGVIETWNRGAEKIFGYTANEVIGNSMEILIPPDRQHEETEILALLKLGEKVEHFETVRRRKDGRLIDISTTISPILNKDGKVIGVSQIARDISLQKRSSRLVWDQTNFDQLTNLPNRSLFFDRLSKELLQTRRSNKHLALLFLDLDGFKPVNDRYGHDAGDSVLKAVAKRWLACVREADTVARLGGNEFAVILGDLGKPDEASLVAETLIQALALKIPLAYGRECRIGTSVGISIYPDNATAMDSLLSTADAAMYESKKRGGNTYTFSDAIPSGAIDSTAWIEYHDSYLIGVSEIDDQHRHLMRLLNHLNLAVVNKEGNEEINRQLDTLVAYTKLHFDTEDRLMEQYNFPDKASHDLLHEHLTDLLATIVESLQQGNEQLALRLVKDWVLGHVQSEDKTLGIFLVARGVS